MTTDLLSDAGGTSTWREQLGPGAFVLRGFATANDQALLAEIKQIIVQAPFRHMHTPGGFQMSVAMSNCGDFGWVTDLSGYRYQATDPDNSKPWPALPALFLQLAAEAAAKAGFADFVPNACLINRYEPGARMSLHQDKDERDLSQPIVSLSLGLPAIFQFGGLRRAERAIRIPLHHGDLVVWGGPDRLRYHGVLALKDGQHPLLGACRLNLTLRKAD